MDRERLQVMREAGCSWILVIGGAAVFLRIIDASLVEFFSCFGFLLLNIVLIWATRLILARNQRKP